MVALVQGAKLFGASSLPAMPWGSAGRLSGPPLLGARVKMAKLSMQALEFQLDRQYASKLGRKGGKALRGRKKAKRPRRKEKPFSPLP